jgi:phosphoglycerate dehydrogenase-like enzyme
MKIKVSTIAFSKNQELVLNLKKNFPDAIVNEEGKRFSGQELVDYFSDADGAIIGLEKVDENFLKALPNLRIISKYGVGLDNVDLEACKRHNVTVGWTAGVNKNSVAEMALGFILALGRNLFITSMQLKQGIWNKSGGISLAAKTIGIIGFGHIGKELVRLLEPFKCTILVNDIVEVNETGLPVKFVSKEQIYRHSDFISIHIPLTPDTTGMINSSVFSIMKKNAFIINTARGGIINENDLKNALRTGRIAGAALDVYETEPPVDKELLQLENLVCTPHTGGNSYEAVLAMGEAAINHLVNFQKAIK